MQTNDVILECSYFLASSHEESSSILMVLFASTEAQKTFRVWTPLRPEHSEEQTLHCVANQENSQTFKTIVKY
jgi:hypothetical protein